MNGEQATSAMHRVVVVGGGFGGLRLVKSLKKARVQVTLVDRRNFHLFQPLLYQVATGALSPANIAAPLREIFARQKNVEVLLASVVGCDPERRCLLLDGGDELSYDTLVLAAGAKYNYFGHADWHKRAPSLKTIDDAVEIRGRIMFALEAAEREADADRRRGWLRFVIVGGGPTGVELAGALAEIARYTLKHEFRRARSEEMEIVLVEGRDRLLFDFPPKLAAKAQQALERLGVRIVTGALVEQLEPVGVLIKRGANTEHIAAKTVLWTAGVRAVSLSDAIARATGARQDQVGRLIVEPDLSLAGHPNIFVIGDMAHSAPGGAPLPGVAPVAIQQGKYVAGQIEARMAGGSRPPFEYHDKGMLATIGRGHAIARINKLEFSGYLAWLVWLFVHIMQIVGFTNRVLVLVQWAWLYISFQRSAALITGDMEERQRAAKT